MFRAVPVALISLAAVLPVGAAADIGTRAKTCWNLLPSDFSLGGNVEMIVTTENGLVKNVAVSRYQPDDTRGYAVAEAAAKAVRACSPYEVADGDHQVMMNVTSSDETGSSVFIPLPGQQ